MPTEQREACFSWLVGVWPATCHCRSRVVICECPFMYSPIMFGKEEEEEEGGKTEASFVGIHHSRHHQCRMSKDYRFEGTNQDAHNNRKIV